MALSDADLFRLWGPRCSGASAQVSLNGRGRVIVQPAIVDAIRALNACYIAWRYSTRAADTGGYNCRLKIGGSGWSIHSLKISIDTNWLTNPYGTRLVTDRPAAMNDAIKAIRTNSGARVWTWGGDWSGNKDAMHNQIACSPRDIASGIRLSTVPGGPIPIVFPSPAPNPPEEDDMAKVVRLKLTNGQELNFTLDEQACTKRGIPNEEYRDMLVRRHGPLEVITGREADLINDFYKQVQPADGVPDD